MLRRYKKEHIRKFFDHDHELGELITFNDVLGCIVEIDDLQYRILWSDNVDDSSIDPMSSLVKHIAREIAENIDAQILKDLEAMSK